MGLLNRVWARLRQQAATSLMLSPKGNRTENLEMAIAIYKEVLQFYTRKDFFEDWALITHDLALAYCDRIQGDRADNLEQAIELLEQVLEARPRDLYPEKWAVTMNSLGNAYMDRVLNDRAQNLERAIELLQQSLIIRTREKFPTKWAITQSNLASIYNLRVEGNRADNIEQAIVYSQQALEVITQQSDPLLWAKVQFTLGNSYNWRIKDEQEANLNQAIYHYQQALKIRTRQALPEKWATVHSHLVIVYTHRREGGRPANLERAIFHAERTLQVFTLDAFPEQWARVQNNLANVYSEHASGDWATTKQRSQDLKRVIEHNKQALKVYDRDNYPEQWAGTCNNLANAYMDLTKTLLLEIYEEATETSSHSTHATPFDPMNILFRKQSLDMLKKEQRVHLAVIMEEAIHEAVHALEVFTRQSLPQNWAMTQLNLGNMYVLRLQGDAIENRNKAILHFRQALEVYTSETFPRECRTTARNLGMLFMLQKRWAEAREVHREALKAQQLLYRTSLGESSKQTQLQEASDLILRQAYVLAVCGQPIEAVTVLESGRTRGLAEALQRRSSELAQVYEEDQQTYHEAANSITLLQAEQRGESTRDYLTIRKDLRAATDALDIAIARIRSYKPDFLAEPDYAVIQEVAAEVAPLAYLLTTDAGSLILLIPSQGEPRIIMCDGLTDGQLFMLLRGVDEDNSYITGITGVHHTALNTSLMNVLSIIGEQFIGPLARVLQGLSATNVVLVPCGELAILPLHAAPDYNGRPLLDSITVHYAPSAQTIKGAKRKVIAMAHKTPMFVGVGDPDQTLPFAMPETASIASLLKPEAVCVLQQEQASYKALAAALPGATHLHLACHGKFDPAQPLDSALLLAGQDGLTLRAILDDPALRPLSEMRLVSLSACQSAIIDFYTLPNEVIGLPAAFLQAGVTGVIGTLWPIDDVSTALLMVRFYEFQWKENCTPAEALRRAQLWLRDATAQDCVELCQRYNALRGFHLQSHRREIDVDDTEATEKSIATTSTNIKTSPYAHPYFWAGFVFSGV